MNAPLNDRLASALAQSSSSDPTEADAAAAQLRELLVTPSGDLIEEAHNLEPGSALGAARALSATGIGPDLLPAAGLAQIAHKQGVDEGGVLFAECVDRLAVMSGRPQPFGTVAIQHDGEIIQAPVDSGVTDADRAQVGLPPLDEIRRRILEQARDRAREMADAPALPEGIPYARVWTDPDAATLRARWDVEDSSAWADGDVLTIVGEEPFVCVPTFGLASWPVSGEPELFALSVRVDRLDEAVITYTRRPVYGPEASAPVTSQAGSHDGRFRGENSPPELASNDQLAGVLHDEVIGSEALGEPRAVTIYEPPDAARLAEENGPLPVVYATDGRLFPAYARRLDAAIVDGWCPPVFVVAAHSAPMMPDPGAQASPRALEYLPGFEPASFDRHQRFFVDELAAFAEERFPVRQDRAGRSVFGCSDGGGHAIATGMLHFQRFGHVFAFSTGIAPDGQTGWVADEGPFVHLCAGTLEGAFHQATSMWAFFLERIGAPHHFTERVCGHDVIQWAEEFPRALARAYG